MRREELVAFDAVEPASAWIDSTRRDEHGDEHERAKNAKDWINSIYSPWKNQIPSGRVVRDRT